MQKTFFKLKKRDLNILLTYTARQTLTLNTEKKLDNENALIKITNI